jgi:diaminopimelate decarboxylase
VSSCSGLESCQVRFCQSRVKHRRGLRNSLHESDDPPSIEDWVKTVSDGITQACQAQQIPLPKLLCEPGRSLIGSACVTAYTVGSTKVVPDIRTYVSVDGGMSDNPRPITYQSIYRTVVANRMSEPDYPNSHPCW